MIQGDEKQLKLISAFVIGPYKAKNCGNELPFGVRDYNERLLRKYIREGGDFPYQVLEMHPRLYQEIEKQGIFDYIYKGHFDVLKETDFKNQVSTPQGLRAALICAPNFYRVIEVPQVSQIQDIQIKARNVVTDEMSLLEVLAGLEVPKKGDLVSAHWKHYLRIHDENLAQTNELLSLAREYINFSYDAAGLDYTLRNKKQLVSDSK